jgi:myo-inositol-1(or 4)-monophosphatase
MSVSTFDVAEQAARAGAEIVSRYFHDGVAIRTKESYNLVTDADLESERAVVDVIRRAFPHHAILGEELHAADATAEHLWIVDPLDGTNNFAHAIPHFAVSVAYYRGGEPQCGVVLNPIREDCYTCRRSEGAWHNGRRVRVTPDAQLTQVLIGVGFYYDRGQLMEATLDAIRDLFRTNIHGIRRFGTASLDLCHVGVGMYGAYFEYQLSPWDFAAGRLFVEEAGGRVTTCQGAALPLAKTSVLASNGRLHDAVLEIVARHWAL